MYIIVIVMQVNVNKLITQCIYQAMLHCNNGQTYSENTKQKPPTMKATQVKKENTNTHHF